MSENCRLQKSVGKRVLTLRSTDYGETFVDISSTLRLKNGAAGEESAVISKFYHHPESNCHYVFTGKW